jgi:hypothetical protein
MRLEHRINHRVEGELNRFVAAVTGHSRSLLSPARDKTDPSFLIGAFEGNPLLDQPIRRALASAGFPEIA